MKFKRFRSHNHHALRYAFLWLDTLLYEKLVIVPNGPMFGLDKEDEELDELVYLLWCRLYKVKNEV